MKFLATVLIIFLTAVQAKPQGPATVQGDYAEARSGHVYTCGCLYSGEMVTVGREAILVWNITGGNHHGISLAGVKVAAVVVGGANLGVEGPRRAVLYLDGVTSDAQRGAVLALWKIEYSGVLGQIEAVHDTPIEYTLHEQSVNIKIGHVGHLEARKAQLPGDAHQGSLLWYEPFTALASSYLATVLQYEYSGGDFQDQWDDPSPGIRGYLGKFTLHSRT